MSTSHLQTSRMLRSYGELHDRLSQLLEEAIDESGVQLPPEDRQWLADRLESLAAQWHILETLNKKNSEPMTP